MAKRGKSRLSTFSFLMQLLKKGVLGLAFFWLASILLFSFLPVPYSAVMFQKQVTALAEGDFHYRAKQQWVAQEDISPYMQLAVIASEDQHFPTHWGFDVEAITSMLNNPTRGASTISQQTAKNLFLWNGRSWVRKGLEAGLTVGMELVWSKPRILTVYLNIAEFGEGIFGVEEASRHFFGKPAIHLNQHEAALLAAVLPNPIRFRVDKPSRYIQQRQQWILKQMNLMGGTAVLKQL